MAFVVDTLKAVTNSGDSSGSIVAKIGDKWQENDIILLIVGNDNGGTTIAATGCADVPGTTQTNTRSNRGALLYKVAGASETAPIVTGANDGFGVLTLIIREVDTADPFDVVGQVAATSSTNTIDSPSVTTTGDDKLVIRALAGYDTFGYCMNPPQYRNLGRVDPQEDTISVYAIEDVAETAGATGAVTWEITNADGGSAYTVAFNSSVGASKPVSYNPNLEVIRRYGEQGRVFESTTWAILGASITTLDGVAVNNTDSGVVDDTTAVINVADYLNGSGATSIRWSTAGEAWFGSTHTITSTDFSGKLVSVALGFSNALVSNHSGDKGLAVILFDSSNNWAAFSNETALYALDDELITLMFNDATPAYDSSGTLDWTDIVKVGYAWHRAASGNTTARGLALRDLMLWGDSVFTGGGPTNPIRPTLICEYLTPAVTVDNAFSQVQATTQALVYRNIKIGDGSRDTYYSSSAESMELPKSGGGWKLPDNNVSFKVDATAGSTIDLSASILASDTLQNLTHEATTSSSATYTSQGFNLIHFSPTLRTDTSGQTFIRCDTIDLIGAISISNATIKDSVATGSAMSIDAGSSVLNSTFTKGEETYGIEIPAAGAYDLSSTTFSGYTNDLNVTAASGTVTITLVSGQATPTYTSAGATVGFVQPASVITVTVKDIDTGALIEDAVVYLECDTGGPLPAGTVVLSDTTTATGVVTDSIITGGDQPIFGRVRKASASPFYTNYRISGTITSSGFSAIALMQRED